MEPSENCWSVTKAGLELKASINLRQPGSSDMLCLSVSSLTFLETDISGFINLVPTQEKTELGKVGGGVTVSDAFCLCISKARDQAARQMEPIQATKTFFVHLCFLLRYNPYDIKFTILKCTVQQFSSLYTRLHNHHHC